MGQNSSKRRSLSLGRGKNGKTASLPRDDGDDINGSINVRPKGDRSDGLEEENSTPASPVSATSSSPSKASGKKEKRKRFRVGFSLKRTPSGRWSRKKKTSSLNGNRPVSCPDPLKEKHTEIPFRPQSLFLQEVDIHEYDNKIETVDLSDTEDLQSKSNEVDKLTPRALEMTKCIRGSHKKSSGKKKKKDKKKQKPGDDFSHAVAKPEEGARVLTTTVTHGEKGHRIKKHSNKARKQVPTVNADQQNVDIEAIASSIVAEAVEIAQKRLREEFRNEISSTSQVGHIAESVSSEVNTSKLVNSNTDTVDGVGILKENEDTITIHSETTTATSTIDHEKAEIADTSLDDVNKPSKDINIQAESQNFVQDLGIEMEETSIPGTDDDDMKKNNESENFETGDPSRDKKEDTTLINCNTVCTNVSSNEGEHDYVITPEADAASRAIAKKTVENVIAAALETIHQEEACKKVDQMKTTCEHDSTFEKPGSDSENDNIQMEHGQQLDENKQLEAEFNLKKKSDKEVESVEGNDRNKVHKSADEKIEKQKSKSEKKIKVPKKLSHWFHRKVKQPKAEVETCGTDETELVRCDAVSSEQNQDNDLEHVRESIASHVDHVSTELLPTHPPKTVNPSLALDISEKYLTLTPSSHTESSSDPNETFSPTSSVSSTSPTSDSSELTSPQSVGEKKAMSGFLKKISIGPRLRTAILRKKSSGVADGRDKQKDALTSTNTVEPTALTPPPRKVRQKRLEEQCAPSIPVSHNAFSSTDTSPQSPLDSGNSLSEFTIQSKATKSAITVEDSGIADLTSPEADKPDFSSGDECKLHDAAERDTENTGTINATGAIVDKQFNYNSPNTIEKLSINETNVVADNNSDGHSKIVQRNSMEEMLTESTICSKSLDSYSPLESSKLISTAVIILRSTSNDGQVPSPVELSRTEVRSDLNKHKAKLEVSEENSISEAAEGCCASMGSSLTTNYLSLTERHDCYSTQNVSEIHCQSDSEHNQGRSDEQSQHNCVYAAQASCEPKKMQSNFEEEKYQLQQQFQNETFSWEKDEKKVHKKIYPRVRTIAEYRIGVTGESEDEAQRRMLKEKQTSSSCEPEQFSSVKDTQQPTEESHIHFSSIDENRESCVNNLSDDTDLRLNYSSLVEKKNWLQKVSIQELEPHTEGIVEQIKDHHPHLQVNKDLLNTPHITDSLNDTRDDDDTKNNDCHEKIVSDGSPRVDNAQILDTGGVKVVAVCTDKADAYFIKETDNFNDSTNNNDTCMTGKINTKACTNLHNGDGPN